MRNSPLTNLFNGLNIKIILYFIAFSYIPLMIFSILGYFLNKDLITEINLDHIKAINRSYVNKVSLYFEYKRELLENTISSVADFSSQEQVKNLLRRQNLLKSEFSALELVQQEANEVIFSNQDSANQPYVMYSITEDLMFRGYIAPNELQNLIKSDIPEYNHTLYLFDGQLQITQSSVLEYSPQDLVIKAYMNAANKFQDVNLIDTNNADVFSVYSRLRNFPILLVSQVDAYVFFSELFAFRNKILIANLVLVILLFSLAMYYSRQITSPIHKLIEAVQQIGHGNLNKRIKLETNDEIQVLAHEFELMRQKLYESYQSMEEKIQNRTRDLREAQAQISHQEKMASLGLMAAGIAHEIGNPLTSISSIVQVIKRKNSNEEIIEYLNNILKNIERISRIVRELVEFSRPSSHEEAPTDVNEIINSSVGIIKYDRRSKNIDFILELDHTIPELVLVKDHILQVFLNILINAIDASEGYGNEILVKSQRQNDHIAIEISDQGCGIPDDKLNKIFEPFYTTKEVGRGTGLGLTVSYGFIKKMNGEIKVESTLEKGSTFKIILPIKEETEVEV